MCVYVWLVQMWCAAANDTTNVTNNINKENNVTMEIWSLFRNNEEKPLNLIREATKEWKKN